MPLKTGDRAPDVSLVTPEKQTVSLREAQGDDPALVLFFPLAFSSTCTEELCSVRDDWSAYQGLGARVFAVSVDSPYVLRRFRDETEAPYTFLSDFNREAAEAFDVLRTAPLGPGLRNTSDRSAFVIDPDGVITYAWHSTNPSLIPPFDEIKQALRDVAA